MMIHLKGLNYQASFFFVVKLFVLLVIGHQVIKCFQLVFSEDEVQGFPNDNHHHQLDREIQTRSVDSDGKCIII